MPLVEYPVRKEVIGADRAGQRVDNYLLGQLRGVPRSLVYRILRKGEVRINGGRVGPERRLAEGDEIRIPPVRVETAPVVTPSRELDVVRRLCGAVIYESPEMLVVNKPAGIAVHGGSGVDYGVIEALRSGRQDLRYLELAHRLDRETSGCLMIAKKRSALRSLHEQLRLKTVHKHYWALVHGRWPRSLTAVKEPLLRNELRSGERVVVTSPQGKPSWTDFRILREFGDCTLVEASPRTGRTHQIRVHCAFASHPIVADAKYGRREQDQLLGGCCPDRMFLHARSITFQDPAGSGEITAEAPLDGELEAVISRLERRSGSGADGQ